jgi:hypothetical protein
VEVLALLEQVRRDEDERVARHAELADEGLADLAEHAADRLLLAEEIAEEGRDGGERRGARVGQVDVEDEIDVGRGGLELVEGAPGAGREALGVEEIEVGGDGASLLGVVGVLVGGAEVEAAEPLHLEDVEVDEGVAEAGGAGEELGADLALAESRRQVGVGGRRPEGGKDLGPVVELGEEGAGLEVAGEVGGRLGGAGTVECLEAELPGDARGGLPGAGRLVEDLHGGGLGGLEAVLARDPASPAEEAGAAAADLVGEVGLDAAEEAGHGLEDRAGTGAEELGDVVLFEEGGEHGAGLDEAPLDVCP